MHTLKVNIMPTNQNVIDSNKFWTAPESDIFPLPIVAIALGIGRNKMCQIPVISKVIEKRKFYKKSEILDWLTEDKKKGKESLWLKLRSQTTSIGKDEKNRSKFYDLQFNTDPDSHYKPLRLKGESKKDKYYRYIKEWADGSEGILSKLEKSNDPHELKTLMLLAWVYRSQFIELRLGLPSTFDLRNWYFEENIDKAMEIRLKERKSYLNWKIETKLSLISDLERNDLPKIAFVSGKFISKKSILGIINKLKSEIKQLESKLEDLG